MRMKRWGRSSLAERVGNQNILSKPFKARTTFKIAALPRDVLDGCNWLEGWGKEFLLKKKERKLGARDKKNQHLQWGNGESLSGKRKASYEMLTFASYRLLISFHPSKRAISMVCDFMI